MPHRNGLMSHQSFLPPCRSAGGREGSTPLVGVTSGEAGHARLPIRPVGVSRSRGCGTSSTADADERTRPDRRHPERPANGATPGSGPPPWPCDRTAGTTDAGTGTRVGCAATVWCSPALHSSHAAARPHAHGPDNGHRERSVRGTREPSTGGGVYVAKRHLQGGALSRTSKFRGALLYTYAA